DRGGGQSAGLVGKAAWKASRRANRIKRATRRTGDTGNRALIIDGHGEAASRRIACGVGRDAAYTGCAYRECGARWRCADDRRAGAIVEYCRIVTHDRGALTRIGGPTDVRRT